MDLSTHTSLSPIQRGFAPSFVNYKKGCTRLATASDKVYQLLDQGQWFSPGTPAYSTTKTGRHDIAEILLKVALKHQNSNSISTFLSSRLIVRENCFFSFLGAIKSLIQQIKALNIIVQMYPRLSTSGF